MGKYPVAHALTVQAVHLFVGSLPKRHDPVAHGWHWKFTISYPESQTHKGVPSGFPSVVSALHLLPVYVQRGTGSQDRQKASAVFVHATYSVAFGQEMKTAQVRQSVRPAILAYVAPLQVVHVFPSDPVPSNSAYVPGAHRIHAVRPGIALLYEPFTHCKHEAELCAPNAVPYRPMSHLEQTAEEEPPTVVE